MAGACSGSTSGGIKVFRFQIAMALLKKQLLNLIHPSGIFIQRYNKRPVNEEIIRSVVAFGLTFSSLSWYWLARYRQWDWIR